MSHACSSAPLRSRLGRDAPPRRSSSNGLFRPVPSGPAVPHARAERPSTAFADSLISDLDAVTRGLTMRWNSGPIEGRVNHIKMLKRQMFGRAGLQRNRLRRRALAGGSRRFGVTLQWSSSSQGQAAVRAGVRFAFRAHIYRLVPASDVTGESKWEPSTSSRGQPTPRTRHQARCSTRESSCRLGNPAGQPVTVKVADATSPLWRPLAWKVSFLPG